jgi:enoyl-CoA hydratase/carnithine racemase
MSDRLLSAQVDQAMVLTISNPEMRNALGPNVYAAGVEALNAAETNPEVRAVIITGEGSHFCGGGNLNRLLENRQKEPAVQAESIAALHNWIDSIRTFPKPVIAAVEGAAAGAGLSLALACDFVVAADNAKFVMAYSSVGLSPDGGGSWALARALPRATAMKMLMAAQPMTTPDLRQLGVVSHAAAPGQALQTALNLAKDLCTRAPNVLASIKELVNDAADQTLSAHLAAEQKHFVKNLHHPNGGEGIRSFMEKRTAHYK